jgi:hypothetical protein
MFHTRQSNDIHFLNIFEVLHFQSHPFHDLCDFGNRKNLDVKYVGSDHSKRLGAASWIESAKFDGTNNDNKTSLQYTPRIQVPCENVFGLSGLSGLS